MFLPIIVMIICLRLVVCSHSSKNFTFLYKEAEDCWRLSPAYDLTYSSTYYGEHTTMVDGNGRNPGEKEILAVGIAAGMEKVDCKRIMSQIRDCVEHMLGEYLV